MAEDTVFRFIIDSSGAQAGERTATRSLDKLSKESRMVDDDITRLRKKFKQGGTSAKQFGADVRTSGSSLAGFGKNILAAGGIVFGLTAIVGAMKGVIETGAEFEKTIAELSAITGAAGDDLQALSKDARELGRTTTISAIEVAKGFKLVASAKPELLENQEALVSTTEAAITLAEASGLDLPAAVKALTGSLNQFNQPAEEAGRFINVLAAGSKLGAVEIPQLTEALKVAGTVAAGAGLSFEETVAAIESLGEAELKGAEAGTNLRNVILRLDKQGVSALSPTVVGLATAFENLEKTVLAGLTPLERNLKLEKIFGSETIAAAGALAVRTERVKDLTEAVTGTTTALDQQLIATDTLEDDLKRLSNAYEGVELALSDGVIPGTRSAITFTTAWLNVVSRGIDDVNEFALSIGENLGGAFRTNEGILRSLANANVETIEQQITAQQKFIDEQKKFGRASLLPFSFGILEALDEQTINDAETQLAKLKALRDEAAGIVTDTPGADGTDDSGEKEAQRLAAAAAARKKEASEREAERAKSSEARKEANKQEREGARIVREATADIKKQAGALSDIQDELNPTRQITREYREDQEVLGRALKENVITDKEFAAANRELTKIFEEQKKEIEGGTEEIDQRSEALKRQDDLLASLSKKTDGLKTEEEDLNQLLKDGKLDQEEFANAIDDLTGRQLQGAMDLTSGFTRGFRSAKADFNDFASTAEEGTVRAFGAMQEGLAGFVKTGKLNFTSLKDSIIDSIIQIGTQAAISEIFFSGGGGNALGGKGTTGKGGSGGLFGTVAGIASGFFSKGGGAGTPGPPGLQDGGVQNTETLARIAEKGPEAVIPLKGGNVPVKIEDASRPNITVQNTFNITTPDAGSFGRSQGQIEASLAQSIQRALGRNG